MNPQASDYRLLELRWERRAVQYRRQLLPWLGWGLLDTVAGYGERPGRIFVSYLLVVSFFAVIYWAASNFLSTQSAHLQWYETVVLSLSSFHGRGFFPQTISLGDPLAIIAAFEAVIGLFIELVLIATFSRRFLGD